MKRLLAFFSKKAYNLIKKLEKFNWLRFYEKIFIPFFLANFCLHIRISTFPLLFIKGGERQCFSQTIHGNKIISKLKRDSK
ncbi:Hypothetical protein NCDO2118_1184 [Lactococcus lactis subsp. lactis NCDO 2118]|uniref:Uncharacterized protein n=1 Tax=Lactococcus lactis subsp. lactis NCDO 2118 TaxID=1117941 RepID=A0ABC8A679_LACLL|nr:Hypothetical protein LLKF_1210 [Lactococcus lactis subsp. lactis KF147]AII12668.1 Hypothetical protein NCDO2118_1184 [Lactococcus lactis subsp. lactis NCDO 2118]ATY87694.1 hypothetical protein CV702_05745 [Lactococcus lactis subsp. lactis]ATZ01241.1 hypothetical protein CV098_05330 [Lactococcus lactis subsp. lactis]